MALECRTDKASKYCERIFKTLGFDSRVVANRLNEIYRVPKQERISSHDVVEAMMLPPYYKMILQERHQRKLVRNNPNNRYD
jgi:hypothetical protein